MKAVLEFSLPDEQEAFDDAVRGDDWRRVTEAALGHIREVLKYGEPSDTVVSVLEGIRTEILDALADYGLHAVY